jgi:hypothetical protein
MAKVTYNPTDGSDTITEVFGQVFEAGDSVDIKDEKHLEKLRLNPQFEVAGAKASDGTDAKSRAAADEKLSKVIDGRSKEAREARAKAEEAGFEADAKERAAQQAKAIAEAKADPDKD